MIIKGGSRGGPEQLARHLQRRDTNEMVDILETLWPSSDLQETFRDWQTLSEGTHGTKGLYHVNIDPAKDYVMSMEQWQRSVEVLEKELGFEGQPRVVVMHQKHGRQHLHIVWSRTDVDTMTLRSDSWNYAAHERASKALELEFGHELVPGKHAKRDRKKQKEFPRAEYDQAEWQQGERTKVHPEQRRDEITALRQASDGAESFRAALEDHGYILARGDKIPFVIVDGDGEIYSLARQLRDLTTPQLRKFLEDIDPQSLPTADAAAEIQRQRSQEKQQTQAKQAEPSPPGPDKATTPQAVSEPEVDAIRAAEAGRHEKERQKWLALQAHQLERKEFELAGLDREAEAAYVSRQREEMDALKARLREEMSGLNGFIEALQRRWNPQAAAEKTAARRREISQLMRRQERERRDYLALREQTHQLEIENVRERHAQQLRDLAQKSEEDLERYIREHGDARLLRAEIEAREKKQEQERSLSQKRDGPEWPPPPTQ